MGRLEIWLQSFITLALNAVECSASCYRIWALVSINKRLGQSQLFWRF